jgi:hypothetical protein
MPRLKMATCFSRSADQVPASKVHQTWYLVESTTWTTTSTRGKSLHRVTLLLSHINWYCRPSQVYLSFDIMAAITHPNVGWLKINTWTTEPCFALNWYSWLVAAWPEQLESAALNNSLHFVFFSHADFNVSLNELQKHCDPWFWDSQPRQWAAADGTLMVHLKEMKVQILRMLASSRYGRRTSRATSWVHLSKLSNLWH